MLSAGEEEQFLMEAGGDISIAMGAAAVVTLVILAIKYRENRV
jgi:hypothetical protein